MFLRFMAGDVSPRPTPSHPIPSHPIGLRCCLSCLVLCGVALQRDGQRDCTIGSVLPLSPCKPPPPRGRATLHLNLGSEGGQREVQHGDELVILAARTLLKLCSLYDCEASASGDYRWTTIPGSL